ncbi:MAG: hypothetical protein ACO3BA_08150 [Schleiferiaceae bacterium]
MRQFFALVALSGALMLSAQSIKKETLTYARLQPPTDHSADGQSFKTTVNLTYKAEIDRAEAAAEAEYQAALAAYPAQEAAAKAAYDERVAAYEKALADWNNKSLAGKIIEKQVLENSKPVPPPPYQAPYPPQRKQLTHQALFSEVELAQSYGRIEAVLRPRAEFKSPSPSTVFRTNRRASRPKKVRCTTRRPSPPKKSLSRSGSSATSTPCTSRP